MFFFTASFNLILPEMNQYLSALGGSDYKGWIIALFTISAGISRPFSGKLSDKIGRKRVMAIGIFMSLAVCVVYPFCFSVWFFLLMRFMHGFASGFYPTGATALVTDLLPDKERGAKMGIWGTFISLGIGAGQGLSSTVKEVFTMDGLFIASAVVSALSYYLMSTADETLINKQPFKWKMLSLKFTDIIEPRVVPVAMVMFLSATCSGIIFVLAPEIAGFLEIKFNGVDNKGWFFVPYVVSTIGVRLLTGRVSDMIGRRETLFAGMILLAISMVMIGSAGNFFWFTISAVLFGLATGMCSPTIFAWTADLSPAHRRGVGAGTMFIALEFGICFGSIVTNVLYDNTQESIFVVFAFGATMAVLTIMYLIWHLSRRTSVTIDGELNYQRKKRWRENVGGSDQFPAP